MVVMGVKTSVILITKTHSYLDGLACPTSIISHSNALPLEEVVLGGNGNM